MTWYQTIDAVQEPFDMGVDGIGRAQVVFNVSVVKGRSATFYHEIYGLLLAAGFVASGRITVSSKALIPSGVAPSIQLIETGGTSPDKIHNVIVPKYARPSMEVVTRAGKYSQARSVAEQAYLLLTAVRNQDVTPSPIP